MKFSYKKDSNISFSLKNLLKKSNSRDILIVVDIRWFKKMIKEKVQKSTKSQFLQMETINFLNFLFFIYIFFGTQQLSQRHGKFPQKGIQLK